MNYVRLSKEISYALRHTPWEFELELDSEGFVPVEQLISALDESGKHSRPITVSDLEYIIENMDKRRFEIQGDKIRALYGHSVPMHISKEPITPPSILYHGTTHKALSAIMKDGLKPMRRQYVHLSVDTDTAVQVGKRRDSEPAILKIDAAKAHSDGVKFYKGNDKVVLADFISPEYILM